MNYPLLLEYFLKVTPALISTFALLFLVPKNKISLRIVLYIGLFIVLRDAMTPLGIWKLGKVDAVLWMRFTIPELLPYLGASCALLIFLMQYLEPDLRGLVVWKKSSAWKVGLFGMGAALIIAAPSFLLRTLMSGHFVHESISIYAGVQILVFCMVGNLYEEILFRGYLQGYLEKEVSATRAALLSGLAFMFGHLFLAISVTNIGWPLLIFTLYEGLICAFVRRDHGLIASTLAHGFGIFLVSLL